MTQQNDKTRQAIEAAQQAAQTAKQKAAQGRDWLADNSPWSYVGLFVVGSIFLLYGGILVWLAFLVYFVGIAIFIATVGVQAVTHGAQQGDFGKTANIMSNMFRFLWPLWAVIYGGLVFDSIFHTYLFANPLTMLICVAATRYLITRNVNKLQAGEMLRGGRANVAPTVTQGAANKYADIQDEPVHAPPVPAAVIITPEPQPVTVTSDTTTTPEPTKPKTSKYGSVLDDED